MKKIISISLAIILSVAFCFSYVPKSKAGSISRQDKRAQIDAKRIEMKNKINQIRNERKEKSRLSAKHISAVETWSGTHEVDSDVIIDDTSTLIIEPGTEVVFNGYYRIEIQGSLNANGTTDRPIEFYYAGHSAEWGGLYGELDSNVTLNYCNFTDSGLPLETFGSGSAQNCSFTTTWFDVWIEGTSNYQLSNCEFYGDHGINTFDDSTALITNNYFSNPAYSILTFQNSNATITENQFENCGVDSGLIIDIEDDSEIIMDGNIVECDDVNFIDLFVNSQAEIKNNIIDGTEASGAEAIYLYDDSSAIIRNNTISGCYNGIVVSSPNEVIIEDNSICNGHAGITIYGGEPVEISHNNISNNTAYAIFIGSSDNNVNINCNMIKNNNIDDYEFGGGIVKDSSAVVTVNYNDISGNVRYGINNLTEIDINATKNYWGSATGPTHASNPSGTGDAVTDNVTFSPWLDSSFLTPPLINSINLTEGQTIGGIYPIIVDASWVVHGLPLDDMTSVSFYIDGVLMATDTVAPYSFDWNTTVHASPHIVRVVATNVLGTTNERTVNVEVVNELPYTGK